MRPTALVVLTVLVALLCRGASSGSEVLWTPAHELAPGFAGAFIAAGDLDGDGDDDVADFDLRRVYWNAGCSGPAAWLLQEGMFQDINGCLESGGTLGDVDADGDLDVVYGCLECCSLRMLWNVGTPLVPSWQYGGAVAGDPYGGYIAYVCLCDIDADGDLDIVGTSAGGSMKVTENAGTMQDPYWVLLESIPGIGFGAGYGRFALGDLDGDGDLDIVGATSGGGSRCWENVGTPQAWSYVENPAMLTGVVNPPHGVYGLALLDVDCDGDSDLLMGGGYADAYLYLNERITPIRPDSWGTIKAMYR